MKNTAVTFKQAKEKNEKLTIKEYFKDSEN